MKSILQILPSFNTGGVEHTTLKVANSIAKAGCKSFVASSGGDLVKELNSNVVHFCIAKLNSKNPFFIFLNIFKLIKIIKSNSIDVVHARSRAPAWSAYFAARITKKLFITTYHGAYGQNIFKYFYNKVMAKGQPTVVASDFMSEHVNFHYPFARTINIPSGIDTKYFFNDEEVALKAEQLKKTLKLQDNQKIILLVGRFTRIKGHQFLLKAINNSSFLKNNSLVIFVGDSKNQSLVSELENYALKNSINLKVFKDQSDLRPYFSVSDLVIVPTTKPEAFGRVTVEAMSMGKFVIANNLGASAEVLGSNEWVYNIDENGCNLTSKILEFYDLPRSEIKLIGLSNRERAVANYDVNVMLDKHLHLYGII